ncbi:MAG: (Fe-S)-binding protein [Actinomycetota bacterium]|nr:(Fe-S)-binding protein [Actinomycetota bacterium]
MTLSLPKNYIYESCDECGICLEKCPVMELPPSIAKREIGNLRRGVFSKVLLQCTSCMDCDFFCPNSSNPAELILQRWNEKNSQDGLLLRARYFLPHSRPNFRTYLIERMSGEEIKILHSWAEMTPAEEVCYPGCNIITTPLLTRTKALSGLDIRGTLDYCCGEMYFRMGLFEQVRAVARKLQNYFQALAPSKVTILCTAGYYMFTVVLPHFGAKFDFEIESYLELLKRRFSTGELGIQNPLGTRIAIQDSCYAKQFGSEYMNLPRELLAIAGANVVEMTHSRECMLCCGIGAGFTPWRAYNPLIMARESVKILREAKKSGAEAIAVYCSGCLQMLRSAAVLYREGPPTFHILELLGAAMGEDVRASQGDIGRKLFWGALENQFPTLLSRKSLEPPRITPDIQAPSYLPRL